MDISNLSSAYNDLYASASNTSTSKLENQLKSDYSKATDDELMDACKQFEAYFLEQVFKGMEKTIPKMWRQMLLSRTAWVWRRCFMTK